MVKIYNRIKLLTRDSLWIISWVRYAMLEFIVLNSHYQSLCIDLDSRPDITNKGIIMTRTILLIITIVILTAGNCFAGQWLFHHNEKIKGQVVEADTRKPIEGALIIAVWKLEDVVNEGPGGYDRIEVVESGKDGRFVIPSWFSFKPWQLLYKIEDHTPFILIFKPGYKVTLSNKSSRDGHPGDTSLTEDEKKRIKEMSRLDPAKLEKIANDKERLESLNELGFVDFPDRHFSKKQLRKILRSYEIEVNSLSNKEVRKKQLLINVADDKKRFLGE
jgi:hypothetical protein